MDNALPAPTAVAVRGDRIVEVGDLEDVDSLVGENTRVIELGDRALIPGFVDSHGHILAAARLADFLNLSSPPVGNITNIADIRGAIGEFKRDRQLGPDDWIVGYGYDDSLLSERRHPDKRDIDEVSGTNPVFLVHVSGHLVSANSAALDSVGITPETEDPDGGHIRRFPGSREPDGVLEETASHDLLFGRLAAASVDHLESMLRTTMVQYAANGITTAQDGAATPDDIALFRAAASRKPFPIDVAAYRYESTISDAEFERLEIEFEYSGGFRLAGIKFGLDGSPQGRTAWMTEPYVERPPGTQPNYTAYRTTAQDHFEHRVTGAIARSIPVLVHANGDAAIDAMLDGIENAGQGGELPDHRSVIVHAQLMRSDQLERSERLGAIPSFFSAHTFFWGDWHTISFGLERARDISPTRWAVDSGVTFTIHNDAPVVPPDMMRLIWATVVRRTRSGEILGTNQRLSVLEALEAATLSGAYQLFEEDEKGSIAVGKRADLVILGANPLSVEPDLLKNIPIVETFAEGVSVYRTEPQRL